VHHLERPAIAIAVVHAGGFILPSFGWSTAAPDRGGDARPMDRVLAHPLGLRNAFDADNIMAIDHVIRKLISKGRRRVCALW
jgi:high-affinity nickel permease